MTNLTRAGPAWRWLRELMLDLLALLWPTSCAGCGFPDRDLCDACRSELSTREVREHHGVGAPCFVAGDYTGIVREALVAFKHRGAFGFAKPLGRRLGAPLRRACAEAARDPPLIVTIPTRRKTFRQRGYRHVDELVRVALAAERIPAPRVAALALRRGRTSQVGLGAEERARNARRITGRRGMFGVVGTRLQGAGVIIVDDVITTGATMRAARDALTEAGATVIACVALCGVVRKDTPDSREK